MSAQTLETVEIGTWVKMHGLVPGEGTVIHFVPESEVNYSQHKLPPDSFLGEALRDVAVGDKVHFDALGNDLWELMVMEVGRD